MTISSETARVSYTASGATTFDYTWKIFDEADLLVVLRDTSDAETTQVLNTDYTVTGVGDSAGGTIVFATAPTATDTVVIVLDPEVVQELNLTSGAIPSESLESGLDKIVNMIKRLYDKISRTINLTEGGTSFNASSYRITEVADPEDDQDAATKAYVDSTVATGALNTTVSAFGATLIDDANSTVARTTLGAGTIGSTIFGATSRTTVWNALEVSSVVSSTLENSESASDWRSFLFIPDIVPWNNPVINADFQVWQTGTSVTNATTVLNSDDTYFADQWFLLSNGNSVVNLSNSATTFGYPTNCYGLVEITAVTTAKFAIVHPIESAVTAALKGKTVTVSLWTNSDSNLRAMRLHLASWSNATFSTPNIITSDVVSAWNGATTKPTAIAGVTLVDATDTSLFNCGASAWTQVFATFAVPSDAQNIGVFIGSDDASYATNDKVAFSGVQINLAGLSTPFWSRPFAQELMLCERFYKKTFPYATTPAQNVGSTTGALFGVLNSQASGGPIASVYWHFPVRMVRTPTVTTYNPTAAAATWDVIGNTTAIGVTVTAESETGALIYSSTASGTGILDIHATADARL